MALPTKSDVSTMKFSRNGSPWVNVVSKSSIDLGAMAFSLDGSPWFGAEDGGAPPSSDIASVNSLSYASVGTFNGLSMASVESVNELA